MSGLHVAVISARRPHAVGQMTELAGSVPLTWYVGEGEADAYRAAGAEHIVEAGALCAARNAALDAAGDRDCVQLSDDLRSLGWAHGTSRDAVEPLSLTAALRLLRDSLLGSGAWLAGAMPTANPFYSAKGVQRQHFIVGDLMYVTGGCPLRFDEALRLKEDYDYTLQHLRRYGQVARVGRLLASFTHRTNAGGAVAYRTADTEQNAIAYLKAKWPASIVDNPRRPNEVLLKWKGAA